MIVKRIDSEVNIRCFEGVALMTASVRLMPTKLAAAALAAGVVATGVSIGAAERAVPTIEANVVPTSLITDALAGAGWVVDGLAAAASESPSA